MKSLRLFYILILFSSLNASNFIHPLDFKGTKSEQQKVTKYIIQNIERIHGADFQSILRMMEKADLEAFKELTKVKNRKVLDRAIKEDCEDNGYSITQCTYFTIQTFYNSELQASKEKLAW